jgi:hypothetical protein
MKKWICLALFLAGAAWAMAGQVTVREDRFLACDNPSGGGFFWIDTTSGHAWWLDPFKMAWLDLGRPEKAGWGPAGKFHARENKGGDGFFLLEVGTGVGWWRSETKPWTSLGEPPAPKQ